MSPVDAEHLRSLEFTGRPREQIELVEAYAREQGMFGDEDADEPTYSESLALDLGDVVPSLAGPRRPQDRVALTDAQDSFRKALALFVEDEDPGSVTDAHDEAIDETFPASDPPA